MDTCLRTAPYDDFESAAQASLELLHQRLGFGLWMVTRTEGDDWIVLQAVDHGYDVKPGAVFRWVDSFCSQMVLGKGPFIAPRSVEVPEYAAAPIGRQVPIGAYIGVPLSRPDGSLFGTLCAIDPTAQPQAITAELPLIQEIARLLCTILRAELQADDLARRSERVQVEALTDALTGLFNRRGWDQLLAAEEARCRRYGHPACVLAIDLDGLKQVNDTEGHGRGDELLGRTARALEAALREPDAVARVGGDEFLVLGVECDAAGAEQLRNRIDAALAGAGIAASVGCSRRDPRSTLESAVKQADADMYANKRARQAAT